MARNFRELEVWQLGYQITIDLYKLTEKFPKEEVYNITSQIRRASLSIPLNIAEGCSRFTKDAFLQFLSYAYGSTKELEVLLELARDLKYINNKEYKEINDKVEIIAKKLFTFMYRIKKDRWFEWFKER